MSSSVQELVQTEPSRNSRLSENFTILAMDATTLVTFLFRSAPGVRSVELLGSWDNFTRPYPMERDLRKSSKHWSGCFKFSSIVFDGDTTSTSKRRNGGLKQGGTYWYFYRVDDDVECHDPAKPSTTSCPLLPGQVLNVLEVPVELSSQPTRPRSASSNSDMFYSHVYTMDPKDKYTTPRPTLVRKIPRLFTASAEKFRESTYHLPTVLKSRLRFADYRQEGSSVSLDDGLVDHSKSDSFAVDDNDDVLEPHALLSGSTSAPLRKSSMRPATCNEDDICESSESASDGIEPSTVLPAAINHIDETTLYANRYEGRSVSSSIARSAEMSIMMSRGRQLISQRSNNASWDDELPEVLLRHRRSTRIERGGQAPHSLKEPDGDLSAKRDVSHDLHHCTSISSPSPTTEASAFDLRSPTFSSFTISSSGITSPFRLSDQSIPPTNHLAYSNDADADAALDHISEELSYFSDEHDYTSEPALCLSGLYAPVFDNTTAAAKRHGAVFDLGRSAPSLQRYELLRGGEAEAEEEEEMGRAVPSKAEEPLPQIALTGEMSMMEEIASELECLGGAAH
ncbi:hypothetical protein B0A49_03241 [Cryomyces minteri]|uniref:Uncharacterized protein n=1 Tax=Cryomyces minteri TaxID=331657 RepID=A0A4U0X0V8_9PEZI|nr:hypothetical protein B0A49_03241 [Cryomyces minteri]